MTTASRASVPKPPGRVKRKRMWAVLNYDRLMNVGHTRRGVQDEISGTRAEWQKSRRKGHLRCVRVIVTWSSPLKRTKARMGRG